MAGSVELGEQRQGAPADRLLDQVGLVQPVNPEGGTEPVDLELDVALPASRTSDRRSCGRVSRAARAGLAAAGQPPSPGCLDLDSDEIGLGPAMVPESR